MALVSTEPLSELSTSPTSRAVSFKSGNLNFLEASGPLQDYTGIALSFFYLSEMGKRPHSLNQRRSLWVYLKEGKYSYAKNSCTSLIGKILS
jgi:hypothetical protein